MRYFDAGFAKDFKLQSWSLYSGCMLFILLRLFSRLKRTGVLERDDYVMILAAGMYTVLISSLNAICQGGGSNLYPPELAGTFTEREIQDRIYGSKIVVISEQAMLNVIYSIKICVIIMYTRMTLGLVTRNLVRYLAWYVFVGWTATEIAFFTACRPFKGYWAMPPPDPQCATLQRYAVVQACFNISSDLLLLWVPIPLVLKTSAPWRQKAAMLSISSLAGFVIVAALLTKVFNLSNVWDPQYMHWYVREASVVIYVSNIPAVWPLLRDWVLCLRNLYVVGSISSGGRSRRSRQQQHSRNHEASESTPSRREFTDVFSSLGRGGGSGGGGPATITGCRRIRTGSRAGLRGWPGTGGRSAMEHDLEMGMGHPKDCGGGDGSECSSMERMLLLPSPPPPAKTPPPSPQGMRAPETKNKAPTDVAAAGLRAIHVKRTIEITSEDRDQNPSVAALDSRRGGAFIYNWEQSGISKHCVVVRAEK